MLEMVARSMRRGAIAPLVTLGMAACFLGTSAPAAPRPRASSSAPAESVGIEPAPPVRLVAPTIPHDTGGLRIFRAARRNSGMKILVSTEDRWLWLIQGRDTLMSVPVAVGMGESFSYQGRKWFLATPRGRRTVLNKIEDPVWTVPDWQYYEEASDKGLQLVRVQPGKRYDISTDSTGLNVLGAPSDSASYLKYITIRDGLVGWVNKFDEFTPADGEHYIEPPGTGKLFMPPETSDQRKVHHALGPYALNMGDGDLLHGTNEFDENSIGRAVSHGCVRLNNDEVTRLYSIVPAGTPVYIF